MGKFLNGVFVGIGIGLFIAPQTGEETRRLIMERVAALRQSILEDKTHLSINTQPSQVPPFLAQPAQPAAESFGEPQVQETPSAPATQPVTESFGEPEEQATPRVPPVQPAGELFSEPQVYETPSVPVTQPETEFFNEPQVQGITMPPDETLSTSTDQDANVPANTSNIAHTAQAPGSTTNPEEQTPTEAPHTDTATTDKLPPLSSSSNIPGRTARRKPSSRTPSTGKANKGHGRS